MFAAWVTLMVLGQTGSDVPRAEPDVRPTEERVCIDDPRAPPEMRCLVPPTRPRDANDEPVIEGEPPPRLVGAANIFIGALLDGSGTVAPEFAFNGEFGVRFNSGIGVVGLLHGNIASRIGGALVTHRYGLGVGVRFGERSRIVLGFTPTMILRFADTNAVYGGATFLAQGVLVIGKFLSFLIMPSVTIGGAGVMGSLSAGLGATFF